MSCFTSIIMKLIVLFLLFVHTLLTLKRNVPQFKLEYRQFDLFDNTRQGRFWVVHGLVCDIRVDILELVKVEEEVESCAS
jgi:hypothetical protein